MIINFLVITVFDRLYDLKALILWVSFFSIFYWYFDEEIEAENFLILKELNKKIDFILSKVK